MTIDTDRLVSAVAPELDDLDNNGQNVPADDVDTNNGQRVLIDDLGIPVSIEGRDFTGSIPVITLLIAGAVVLASISPPDRSESDSAEVIVADAGMDIDVEGSDADQSVYTLQDFIRRGVVDRCY